MSHQVTKVRRSAVAPCMTCLICNKFLREATTIIECLHTFCRKCIYKKLSDEEMDTCPVCHIDLGCSPLEKLRPDHNLQDILGKLFPPKKRIKVKAPENVPVIALPAKRKERSLSSLVISTPKVSTQTGMTGRRSKSTARKASRGSSFTIEKPVKQSVEDQPESSGSPDSLNKFTQNMKQKSTSGGPSSQPNPDKGRKNSSENREGKQNLWKPLTCLVEAANRSKSSKLSTQVSLVKSDEQHTNDNEGFQRKSKNKELRKKLKVTDEKNLSDYTTPPESDRPKKLRKTRQKAQSLGEFKVPAQVVLDVASAKSDKRNHHIWFSLVASDELDGDAPPLPQISASYLRIKDGSIPVSFIQKYLKRKLALTSEAEVDIKCMGQTVIPTLTLNNLVDLWLQTTSTEKITTTIGSSGKDFVMVLGYARRCPDC
ncbi:hypothetical protein ACS0TY_013001 [Phlomoides rotata]